MMVDVEVDGSTESLGKQPVHRYRFDLALAKDPKGPDGMGPTTRPEINTCSRRSIRRRRRGEGRIER